MEQLLYLECSAGISGDMVVAALLDAGASEQKLCGVLEGLDLDGFSVEITRVKKSGLDACDFNVVLDADHDGHDHDMAYLYGHAGWESSANCGDDVLGYLCDTGADSVHSCDTHDCCGAHDGASDYSPPISTATPTTLPAVIAANVKGSQVITTMRVRIITSITRWRKLLPLSMLAAQRNMQKTWQNVSFRYLRAPRQKRTAFLPKKCISTRWARWILSWTFLRPQFV